MFLKSLKKKLVSRLGPLLAYWAIRILGRTMRFEEVHPEIPRSFWGKGIPTITVFWHGRLLMMPLAYRGRNLSVLISPHRDGQVVGKALERFGFHTIWGSTTRRGFSALRKMLTAHQDGSDLGLVPDGPRGPRYRVQIGAVELARLTGRPIIPLAFSASRKKTFSTWDRFLLPYPFSRGVYIWGDPIYVDKDGDRALVEEKRTLLERSLNELTDQADHYFDSKR